MPNSQEIDTLINLLKQFPNIPEDFNKRLSEKLPTLDYNTYIRVRESILKTARKFKNIQKCWLSELNTIQREKVNPGFKGIEEKSENEEAKKEQKILSQLE